MSKYIIIPAMVLLLSAGFASAQTENEPKAGLVPGNPLYSLDILAEKIGDWFTIGEVAKAERALTLAAERLAEARELANADKSDRAEKAAAKYEEKLDEALERADKAKEDGKDVESLMEKIASATVRHQEVLAEVLEKVPEQAKEAIERAMENSQRGHNTALEAVSGQKQGPNGEKEGEEDNGPSDGSDNATSTENRGQSGNNRPENSGNPNE